MNAMRCAACGLIAGGLLLISGCCCFQPSNSVIASAVGQSGIHSEKVVDFHVVGKGLEPESAVSKGQAIIMAERAAVADGYRKLVEKISGVYVDAYMKSGQGVVDYDIIRTQAQSWLRGAEIIDVKRRDFGITEAHMSLRINFVCRKMIWWPVGIGTGSGHGPNSVVSSNGVQ